MRMLNGLSWAGSVSLGLLAACGGGASSGGSDSSGGGGHAGDSATDGRGSGGTTAGGGGSTSGTGGTASTGGASGKGGTGGTGGSIEPAPENFPLLVAVGDSSVDVWQNADEIGSAEAPSFSLPLSAFEVFTWQRQLGFVSADGIRVFRDLKAFDSSAVPAVTLPASALVSGEPIDDYFLSASVDEAGALWLTHAAGEVALFPSLAELTNESLPSARFVHEWGQIRAACYDAPSGTLLAVQVSGAGVLAFKDAKNSTGEVEADGAFSNFNGQGCALDGGTLFVGGGFTGDELAVWSAFTVGTTPVAPSPTLNVPGGFLRAANGALALADYDEVHYFPDTSSLVGTSTPESLSTPHGAQRLDLTQDGRTLAVATDEGITLARYASGSLSSVTQLQDKKSYIDVTWVE